MAQWLQDVSVGEWFQAGDVSFEIVGIDAQAGIVLVQHFDGSLEEFDFDSWLESSARPCAPPEDISGALDLDRDDCDDPPGHRSGRHAIDALNLRLDEF